jgi:hypothetical protein
LLVAWWWCKTPKADANAPQVAMEAQDMFYALQTYPLSMLIADAEGMVYDVSASV